MGVTSIEKSVRRVSRAAYGVLFPGDRRKHRRIVAKLGPADCVQLREFGRRTWYSLPLDQVFSLAVKGSAGWRLVMVPGPRPPRGSSPK